jgi:hypothetical protein
MRRKRWIIKGLVSASTGAVNAYLGSDEKWFADSSMAKLYSQSEAEAIKAKCHPFRGMLCATGIGGAVYIQHLKFIEVVFDDMAKETDQ